MSFFDLWVLPCRGLREKTHLGLLLCLRPWVRTLHLHDLRRLLGLLWG